MSNNAIYVNLDDIISSQTSSGIPVMDIKKGSSVYRRSGGGGFVRDKDFEEQRRKATEEKARREEEAKKKAVQLAKEAAESRAKKEAEEKAKQNLREIQQRINKMRKEDVKPTIKDSVDIKTKEPLRIIEYKKGSSTVRVTEETQTGKIRFREYGAGTGGSVRAVRGVDVTQPKPEPKILTAKGDIVQVNNIPKEKEIYSPELNMFIRPSEPSGQATAYMRPPTPQETEIMNRGFGERFKLFEEKLFGKPEDYEKSKLDIKFQSITQPSKKDSINLNPKKVKSIFDWGAEKTIQVGEVVGNWWNKELEKEGRLPNVLKTSPISRGTAKNIISGAYMFSAFSPVMRTGTAQRTESVYAYDVKRGRFVKKADVKDYLEQPEIKSSGKKVTIKEASYSEKAGRLKELLRGAKTPEQRKEFLKLARETYGEGFAKEFASQEFGYIPTSKPPAVVQEVKPQSVWTGKGMYELTGQEIRPVSVNVRTAGTLSQVGETNWVQTDGLGSNVFQDIKTNQQTKQGSQLMIKQINILDTRTRQKQEQTPKQDTKQDSMLRSLVTTLQTPKMKQPQKTKQDYGQDLLRGRPIRPRPPKKPTPFRPIIPIPSDSLAKRLLKKVETEGFEVFGKRFGKDISLGFSRTKKGAEKKLESFLKGTLGRSGYVSQKGKKVQTDLLGDMFRPSKRDPFRVVQKSKYSLGSGSEVREIQFFKRKSKRKKKSGWGWF